jgi:hypothetical protein
LRRGLSSFRPFAIGRAIALSGCRADRPPER